MHLRDEELKGKGASTVFPNSKFSMSWRMMMVIELQLRKLFPIVVINGRLQRHARDSLQQPSKALSFSVRDGRFLRTRETSEEHWLKALPKVRRLDMSERVTCVSLHPAKLPLIVSRRCMLLRKNACNQCKRGPFQFVSRFDRRQWNNGGGK